MLATKQESASGNHADGLDSQGETPTEMIIECNCGFKESECVANGCTDDCCPTKSSAIPIRQALAEMDRFENWFDVPYIGGSRLDHVNHYPKVCPIHHVSDCPPCRKELLIEKLAALDALQPGQGDRKIMGEERYQWLRQDTARLIKELPATIPTLAESRADAINRTYRGEPWQIAGEMIGDWLSPEFRYNADAESWHHWDGKRWREMPTTTKIVDGLAVDRYRLGAIAAERGATEVANNLGGGKWETYIAKKTSELWSGIRRTIDRPLPAPDHSELATPDGVIDLRTGRVESHDSFYMDTLAVTRGRYRPDSEHEYRAQLFDWCAGSISAQDYQTLIKVLGIAVSRQTNAYCSLLWLHGASGSGKGRLSRLLLAAFGGSAKPVMPDLLTRRMNDIDAQLTDILEADPIILSANEVDSVAPKRLLSITGGDALTARRPHGKPISRELSGLLVCTSVDAPKLAAYTGATRRLTVLGFPTRYTGEKTDPEFGQHELDAIITLAVAEAMRVGGPRWIPPETSTSAKAAFLADADPVSAWLDDLPASYAGTPVKDALDAFNAQAEDAITATKFGRRVNAHPVWSKRRLAEGGPMALAQDGTESVQG